MIRYLALAALMAACNDTQARPAPAKKNASVPQGAASIRLQQVAEQFRSPVYLTAPTGDPRLFIVEQAGRIRIVKNGNVVGTPFLDIADRVRSGGEQGLLSMAFHPDYRNNGLFFVNFTDREGDTHIERFKVSSNPDVADAASAKLILKIDQPYSNHNGGLVMFGPDGMLYIGMGDGGSGGDPRRNGQNRDALLGKILRINVSRTEPYSIPEGNPFRNGGGRPEIWAVGMRNPWRFAFDRATGMLYIADVGQNEWEEVNVEPASRAGLNYGWNIMEGTHCYRDDSCDRSGLTMPKVEFNHVGNNCSVTGGFVYRGRAIPALAGTYFYSDYCGGWLKSFKFANGAVSEQKTWSIPNIGHVVSFGEDSSGELYILSESGRVWKIIGGS
ncbi:MAG TPA: PQQ-dependent sugar dehydrogenase [Gemmatimonadaceae bacterium]